MSSSSGSAGQWRIVPTRHPAQRTDDFRALVGLCESAIRPFALRLRKEKVKRRAWCARRCLLLGQPSSPPCHHAFALVLAAADHPPTPARSAVAERGTSVQGTKCNGRHGGCRSIAQRCGVVRYQPRPSITSCHVTALRSFSFALRLPQRCRVGAGYADDRPSTPARSAVAERGTSAHATECNGRHRRCSPSSDVRDQTGNGSAPICRRRPPCKSTTTAANARCAASRSAARIGSLPATSTAARLPQPSSASSAPRGCTNPHASDGAVGVRQGRPDSNAARTVLRTRVLPPRHLEEVTPRSAPAAEPLIAVQ
jgi:hypothetical protein